MTDQVNRDQTNSNWNDFGLPMPTPGTNYTQEVKTISNLAQLYAKDGLTKLESEGLKSIINITISDPELPPADKKVLMDFLDKINQFEAMKRLGHTPPADSGATKAYNEWMVVSAVCALFTATNEIASIISKMAREESKLRQAMGNTMIAMAKESMTLTIQAGELRAQQQEAEAAKCWTEFGMALGQMVVTVTSYLATTGKEQELKTKMEKETGKDLTTEQEISIYRTASDKTQVFTQVLNQTLEGVKSAIEATIYMKKADLERDASKSEGVKQLLDKMFQLLQDTYSMIGDDMRDQRQTLDKLFQILESAQRSMAEQWKA